MSLQVRDAVAADVAAIAALHVAGWQVGYRGLLPDGVLDALRPQDRVPRWRAAVADPDTSTLVVEDAGVVAGVARLGADRGGGTAGEVYSFYVHPDHWRTGVGRLLMTGCVDRLRTAGFAQAVLWVLDTNEPARRFYTALGWRVDGATKDDVVGDQAIVDVRMGRRL